MSFKGLTELENDAFAEIINIGMGRAADVLSQMVGEEVLLSVPVVEVVTWDQAITKLNSIAPNEISGVMQDFVGTLNGRAMLLFPEEQSLKLVHLLLKENVPLDQITEMEKEALTEVGNIILNACFGTIANTLKFDLDSTVPEFIDGKSKLISSSRNNAKVVMLLQVDFSLEFKNIRGFVTFLMDIDSSEILKVKIKEYVSLLTN